MTREEALNKEGEIFYMRDILYDNEIYDDGEVEKLINKIYDNFENKIDLCIAEAEDMGWYEYNDKQQCLDILYKLKELK